MRDWYGSAIYTEYFWETILSKAADAACFARNERPAAAALRLIKQDLHARRGANPPDGAQGYVTSPGADTKTRTRVGKCRVRFTQSELDAISAEATRCGFHNSQEWIVAAVRGALTRAPQFSSAELDRLTDSTRQLAAIGRSLNQLVRVINASPVEVTRINPEKIGMLKETIKTELRNLGLVVTASADRWPLKPAPIQ